MATNNSVNLNAVGITGYDGAGTFTGSAATQYNVQVGGATTHQLASVAPSATAGIPLVSGGSSANPSFTTAGVAGGGTGAVTLPINGALFSNTTTTGAVSSATLTSGQLLIGGTTAPAAATLSAGTGIGIANGNNSITISSTGGGLTWNDVTGTSASAVVNNGYLADNAGLVTITLPATAVQFSILYIAGYGGGGWKIAQNALQSIQFGNAASTTVGTGGSLASTNRYDSVELIAAVGGSSTIWTVLDSIGNITIV